MGNSENYALFTKFIIQKTMPYLLSLLFKYKFICEELKHVQEQSIGRFKQNDRRCRQ